MAHPVNLYLVTETVCVYILSPPDATRCGSVGYLGPGVDV